MSTQQHETLTERRRFLSVREVEQIIGLSRTTIWRMSRAGEFPKSFQISAGRTAYFAEDVDRWVASKREQVPA